MSMARMAGVSGNIFRLFVGHQLQVFHGPLARRAFTTSQRNLDDDGHGSFDFEGPQKASGFVPRSEFHQLDKDMTVVKTHVADLKIDVRDLGKKIDRVLWLLVGGFIVKGGWEIYKEETKASAAK